MKNITIETNYVRVIGNTTKPDIKEMNEMVGLEVEVRSSWYGWHDGDVISLWNKEKTESWHFNKSDVRFLTAGMFKGRSIAIDDEVLALGGWKKVCGFYVYDNEVKILTGTLESTIEYFESRIKDHRTETSLSGTQVTVTIEGKDYQATVN